MSDSKKDLTRIEDLSEYLHEVKDKTSDSDADNEWQNESSNSSLEDFPPEFSSDKTDPAIELPAELFTDQSIEDSSTDNFSTENNFENNFENNLATNPEELEKENAFSENIEEETSFPEEEPIAEENVFEPAQEEKIEETYFEPEPTPEVQAVTATPTDHFQEVKDFASSMALGNLAHEGNPPYSIVLKNLRYNDDINPIMEILAEFQIYKDEAHKKRTKEALERGALLIPRLSEFVAILLCHKLRSFSLSLQMGLADEIHPSHLIAPATGMASKASVFNAKAHHLEFQDKILTPEDIQVATTSHMEGFEVMQYLGVIYENTILNTQELEKDYLTSIYNSLTQMLKVRAFELNANAIIGVNFNMTPMITGDSSSGTKYNLLCTGNAVWIKRI